MRRLLEGGVYFTFPFRHLLEGGIYKRAAFKRGNTVYLLCIFNASAKFHCIEAIVVREKPLDF